jgi:hypothetical protein
LSPACTGSLASKPLAPVTIPATLLSPTTRNVFALAVGRSTFKVWAKTSGAPEVSLHLVTTPSTGAAIGSGEPAALDVCTIVLATE